VIKEATGGVVVVLLAGREVDHPAGGCVEDGLDHGIDRPRRRMAHLVHQAMPRVVAAGFGFEEVPGEVAGDMGGDGPPGIMGPSRGLRLPIAGFVIAQEHGQIMVRSLKR
jgi:hypothetical protein